MTPTCYPSIPVQPMLAMYPASALCTLPVSNGYDQYLATYGVAPPPFQPTRADGSLRPPKMWFDSTFASLPPNTPVAYLVQVAGVVGVLTITAGEASTVNILPDGPVSAANLAAGELPQVPVPIRALVAAPAPNAETLVPGLMSVNVTRADLQNAAAQDAGQFTPADRVTLNAAATAAQVAALQVAVGQIAASVAQIEQQRQG
jgi:hypothetical protein